jgi:hypothetical protein
MSDKNNIPCAPGEVIEKGYRPLREGYQPKEPATSNPPTGGSAVGGGTSGSGGGSGSSQGSGSSTSNQSGGQ